MKNAALLFLLMLFGVPALAETSCAPRIGDCDYYLCREEAHPCGPRGYYLRFSYRYCSEFTEEIREEVSSGTSVWFDRVARCLQEELDKVPLETSCGEMQDEAIASHAHCYVDTGFCQIPLKDQLEVIKTVYREAVHLPIDRAFVEILKSCAKY